jgi:surface protein
MALTDKLTAIADAVREKTGKADEMTLDQMVVEIEDIQTGGVISSSWSRPWDWPNYDTMEKPTSDVLYFTYDCRYGEYACFRLRSGGVVSIGHIDNGVFVEEETEEFAPTNTPYFKRLSPELGDYIVFRVTPLANSDQSKFECNLAIPDGNTNFSENSCREIWGRVHDGKFMHYWVSSDAGVTKQTKAVTLYDFDCSGYISSFYNYGTALEFINLAEWGLEETVTSLDSGFRGTQLREIIFPETWDLKNITSLGCMFQDSPFLRTVIIRNFNTNQVTNTDRMFYNCGCLQTVDLSGCDFSNVTNMNNMFYGCSRLTNIYIDVIPKSVILNSVNLSHDSLIRIINALTTVTEAQTLTIGTTNLAKLTEEEIAVATGKGWTVV